MKKRTTIYDIAKELNITPASVSRALNDHSSISVATRELVRKTAKKLKYHRNQAASDLRTGGSNTIGVIIPKINNSFFSTLIAGIEHEAYANQYNVLISQSDELMTREKAAVATLIKQNVACIMISLAYTTTDTAHLKQAMEHNIPVYQFDRIDDKLKTFTVINNHSAVVKSVIEHLVSQGYKRIAHIAGPQNINIFHERKKWYQFYLREVGLDADESLVVYDCNNRIDAAEATKSLLQSANPPDAIFAASDLAALGALEAAKQLKVKVPQQLGICGFSNEPYTELTSPGITTVDQFSFEMGKTVAQQFFSSLEEDDMKPQVKEIEPALVIRESTSRK
jgi:LacI family transcriptional regulator, repressor for deo operon, udp, cdd, tsx, nupC, and nupG